MKIEIQAIQDHYDTQHGLFQELLECVALEKDSLVELNVESLWNLMEKKQALLRSIETSGNELKAMTRSTPPHDMPVEDRKKVLEKDREIKLLKEEIRTRVRENMDFIQDSLNFFDEIIHIFATGDSKNAAYCPQGKKLPRNLSPKIYHREV